MGRSIDTPLMRQYLEIKRQQPDALLFFRMGDFYELFFDDAVVASGALELTLTSRDRNKEDAVPMCGVPHHAATGYVHRLLELGHKVAICDQVEDPKLARGLVKRAVTQVVTPGVVVDADHLDARTNNYLVAIVAGSGAAQVRPEGARQPGDAAATSNFGLAALDLSTFELRTTELESASALGDELARLAPRELVYPAGATDALAPLREGSPRIWREGAPALFGAPEEDRRLLEEHGGDQPGLGLDAMPLAVAASAAALRYVGSTQPAAGIPACRLLPYRRSEHLQLDEATLSNLEVFTSLMERRREGSLLGVLDATLTAMGARMLRQWLGMPLLEVGAIRRRLDAVEFLVESATLRRELREALRQVYDLERLTARTALKLVTPRELSRVARSLRQLPVIGRLLAGAADASLAVEAPELLRPPAEDLGRVADDIERALVDDPPVASGDGGLIRPGYHAELDELVGLADGGKAAILAIETRERERTGISSLKVRFNRVFGYYLEVTRSNLKSVPADYQRKQTLANAERFITPELAEHEAKVLGAEERRAALEQQLFDELRRRVATHSVRLSAAAAWLAQLDVLAGLAEVAQRGDYVRPEVDESDSITIEEGRHPVVERYLPAGQFVPNDLMLDPAEGRMLIITGPNMAGKSTVMRQTALIVLMAQVGSFVPARRARIGVVDRVFTRVGASDNLARGESTFMVEMRETSAILQSASARSLVVLDEIGRGTATYDGISIAWAVAEHLHDRVRAKCLFATHYHELCALADVKQFARNMNVAVQEWKGRVVFLRKLAPGGSSRSYGIEVARLAGLERTVVARARRVLAALEGGEAVEGLPIRTRPAVERDGQLALFRPEAARLPPAEESVLEELRALDPDALTPLEALNRLHALIGRLSTTGK